MANISFTSSLLVLNALKELKNDIPNKLYIDSICFAVTQYNSNIRPGTVMELLGPLFKRCTLFSGSLGYPVPATKEFIEKNSRMIDTAISEGSRGFSFNNKSHEEKRSMVAAELMYYSVEQKFYEDEYGASRIQILDELIALLEEQLTC
ncbi:hypothetical protein KNT64_gp003 [Pseudomonas phage PspYZU05]|uniref:Uncharacterized protein n=1 Tax=Pseudomonas phage PspYZU05 TaxID=1983556 RepID=A0A2U7N2F4_9CAUD|nr:hypothetical protein KNT64_gp003 [Pseudomonas phage PspYZU05]ASD51955.1 hypothetical protein PspYZU05_03 [Pseudomonas phage PspYZU05]